MYIDIYYVLGKIQHKALLFQVCEPFQILAVTIHFAANPYLTLCWLDALNVHHIVTG